MNRLVTLTTETHEETFSLNEVEDWCEVALRVRSLLMPGMVVALSGPLGAGKTTFVQTLAVQLGIKERPQSPTFSLLRSYRLPTPVHGVARLVHVDAYRIEEEIDLLPLELDAELGDGKTALVIEWPENAAAWLKKRTPVLSLTIQM